MDFVFRIVWKKSGGEIQVWKNGKIVYQNLNAKTVYDEVDNGGRFKFGLNYWRWQEKPSVIQAVAVGANERRLYVDQVRLYEGVNGYDAVRPDQ